MRQAPTSSRLTTGVGLLLLGVCGAAELPLIIPAPRHAETVGDPLAMHVERVAITRCSDGPVVDSGIALLQERLKHLQEQTPTPGTDSRDNDVSWEILVGVRSAPQFAQIPPNTVPDEAQGYAVVFVLDAAVQRGRNRRNRVYLVGNDPVGALYACVTCSRLLSSDAGTTRVTPVNVRDWPDYKIRILDVHEHLTNWTRITDDASAARALDEAKRAVVEKMVNYKVNGVFLRHAAFGHDGDDSFIHAPADPRTAWLKELVDFGHRYGLKFMYYANTAVARVEGNEDNPRLNQLMELRGRYHTWGDDGLLRERYGQIADALAYFGYDVVFFHHADTTNENWPNRSDHDRQRFGDDRVSADANMMNVYYAEVKKRLPNAVVYATVHPYSPGYLSSSSFYHEFFRRLSPLLPPDMGIVLREANRGEYETIRRLYGNRPFATYHEPFHAITDQGTICSHNKTFTYDQPRLLKTFFFPHPDACYLNPWYWTDVNRLLTAQYAWNVDSPGAEATFDYKQSLSEFDSLHPELRDKVLPGVVEEVYGKAQACLPELIEFHCLPFRPTWLALPTIAKRNSLNYLSNHNLSDVELPDDVRQLAEQVQAGERGVALLDRTLGRDDLPAALRDEVTTLRKFALLFKALGPAQLSYVRAVRAADSEAPQSALPLLEKAKAQLTEAKSMLEQENVEGTKWVSCGLVNGKRTSTRWRDEYIQTVFLQRYAALEQAIRKGTPANDRAVSADVLRDLEQRPLRCPRVSEAITIDGKLDEHIWSRAEKATSFIRVGADKRRTVVYPDAQTDVRFLYSDLGLYVGIACAEPQTDSMLAGATKHDDFAIFRDDQVELFFMPNPDTKKYCQLVLNVGGTRLDMLPIRNATGALENNKRWNPDWSAKVAIQSEKGWSAEVRLPWALFAGGFFKELSEPPASGTTWKAFVGRSRRQMEYSGIRWVESFHSTERYPDLVFE